MDHFTGRTPLLFSMLLSSLAKKRSIFEGHISGQNKTNSNSKREVMIKNIHSRYSLEINPITIRWVSITKRQLLGEQKASFQSERDSVRSIKTKTLASFGIN